MMSELRIMISELLILVSGVVEESKEKTYLLMDQNKT